MKTICLGNRHARTKRRNPALPDALQSDLAGIEQWATETCGLDISDVPAVGDTMLTQSGDPDYEVTEAHRCAMLRDRIEQLVEITPSPLIGRKLCTVIQVSPQSTIRQALDEITRCWDRQSSGTPAWVSGTDPVLVAALAEDMGIPEIRDYEVPA